MIVELLIVEADHPRYSLEVVGGGCGREVLVIPDAKGLKVGDILTAEAREVQRERPAWLVGWN